MLGRQGPALSRKTEARYSQQSSTIWSAGHLPCSGFIRGSTSSLAPAGASEDLLIVVGRANAHASAHGGRAASTALLGSRKTQRLTDDHCRCPGYSVGR